MASISKDIIYAKMEGQSEEYLLRAGWFTTKLTDKETEDHYKLNMFGHDLSSFKNNKEEIILFTTGSYAPIHEGHIFSWIASIKKANEEGLKVGLFLISPSHDDYVLKKSESHQYFNIYERIKLIKKGLNDFFIKYKEYQQYEKLFKIDYFESLYSSCAINFSEVLKYIKTSIDRLGYKKVKIGYVFGDDNLDFYKPFINEKRYYAFCVERNNNIIYENYKNIFFIKYLNKDASKQSSTIIRKLSSDKNAVFAMNKNGKDYQDKHHRTEVDYSELNYFVRDDAVFAINHWIKKYPDKKDLLINEYKLFHDKLIWLFKCEFPNLKIISSKLDKQKEILKDLSKNHNVLNLDICSNSDNNIKQTAINYCRKFELSSDQSSSIGLMSREHKKNNKLLPGNYVFVDDDIASGYTFNKIKNKLENINIAKAYSLTEIEFKGNYPNEEFSCFDVVDTRDFLLGSNYGGLMCDVNGKLSRYPYWIPFVNLISRAKVQNGFGFQKAILDYNLEFFKRCSFIKPEDLFIDIKTISNKKFKTIVSYIKFMNYWTEKHVTKT